MGAVAGCSASEASQEPLPGRLSTWASFQLVHSQGTLRVGNDVETRGFRVRTGGNVRFDSSPGRSWTCPNWRLQLSLSRRLGSQLSRDTVPFTHLSTGHFSHSLSPKHAPALNLRLSSLCAPAHTP